MQSIKIQVFYCQVHAGSNSIEGTIKRRNHERTHYIYKNGINTKIVRTGPLPDRVTQLVKGSKLITVTRGYVEFMVRNQTSLALRKWLNQSAHPDEIYAATLNHLPELGVPGAYKGEPETHPIKYPYITRNVQWYICLPGVRIAHGVCIVSVGDLPRLTTAKELFVNKFHLDYEPLALDCMEQYIWYRTANQMLGYDQMDTSYYANLSFVRNHV